MLLLLAVMSVLAAAECARVMRMLPSRSRLENVLGRWVQDCNSNEWMTTCGAVTQTHAHLSSSALNDRTTALRRQTLPIHGYGGQTRCGGEEQTRPVKCWLDRN